MSDDNRMIRPGDLKDTMVRPSDLEHRQEHPIATPTEIAEVLDRAERIGEREDAPEGVRYIRLSDTLAKKLANDLRSAGRPADGG